MSKPLVRVTQIGEYVRHHSCERRFKLDHDDRALAKRLPFFYTLSSAMDPVLAQAGRARERAWQGQLTEAGLRDLGDGPDAPLTAWDAFAARAARLGPGEEGFGREVEVGGEEGAFRLSGRVDFVLVLWRDGVPVLRLVECKASRRDKTYQRVQVALYQKLVRQLLIRCPLVIAGRRVDPDGVECVVARVDGETNRAQDILTLPPLDLTLEAQDAAQLLEENGTLAGVLGADLTEIPYQLDAKCDDCALNVYCLPEAARRREIELLGVDAGAARALHAGGVPDLDALAGLDPDGDAARRVRADPGFGGSLDVLVQKAKARQATLPDLSPTGEPAPPVEARDVMALPRAGAGQLPPHVTGGHRLVRVFLSIHFDYVENRVGAVSAHVTRSDKPLSTLFRQEEGRWRPDPDVQEQWKGESGEFEARPLRGEDIVGILPRPWTGDFDADSRAESKMLHAFFQKIVAAVQALCPEGRAPLHFYVWSQSEITRLVEACARADGDLLASLHELLGCRAGLEQVISSCLGDEVDERYALGWTSRGLAAATSLRWFGRRFHWTRRVGEEDVALDKVFAEGVFDFKTPLKFGDGGEWRELGGPEARRHVFEVRASFQDALPAPYWRAYWGTLPEATDAKGRAALAAYGGAGKPHYLRSYLKARGQALRWIEEGIAFKNAEIVKPALDIAGLPRFTLGVGDAGRAALDFLRLEQHVATSDWLAAHLRPPVQRVPSGGTLPLRDVHATGENDRVAATIDLAGHAPLTRDALAARCSLGEGSFVRLSPCAEDPARAQTLGQLLRGGSTARITALDWDTGAVELTVIPYRREDRYVLPSRAWPVGGAGYAWATLDESLTDFVAGKVDARLSGGEAGPVTRWFDPIRPAVPPQVPLPDAVMARFRALLTGLDLGHGPLAPDQREAALAGLSARVQLLQGPPGTGKTQTTAAALLLRILARRSPGDTVLVTGNTHTSVDTLLGRLESLLPRFRDVAPSLPPLRLVKTDGNSAPDPAPEAVTVLGGTPGALLKLARKAGLCAPVLVVDEASMMVLPYFLAVASLVHEDGEILLAGDHRQLAPIMAHDWEREDRPPARLYRPHVSAYDAVLRLVSADGVGPASVVKSALTHTFRLPPALRGLIARLYRLDALELSGSPASPVAPAPASPDLWARLWQQETGLFLVVHDEHESRQSNPFEAQLIQTLLDAAGVLTPGSVGVVVPHRAQRGLLRASLAGRDAVDAIDTVERFQGGERETILVSATASDPVAISARAEFLLGLNRSNVAFSRARKRLIVVCSARLLSHVPPQTDHYAGALLWKSLRAVCMEPVGETTVGGHGVKVWTTPRG